MKNYIAVLRPKQWIKNLFVFASLFFAQKATVWNLLFSSFEAFCIFCLLSSSIYIINDIFDKEYDEFHPLKKNRPIASGKITIKTASIFTCILIAGTFIGSFLLNRDFFFVCCLYFILNLLYSAWLKKIVIVDVFCISFGFVIRVLAGSIITGIMISNWLVICTMMISLFLGFTKRRHELFILDHSANSHRPILLEYSTYFLDQIISVVTTTTLITYILYTVAPTTIAKFNTENLVYTSIFVLYGIFRYLYLVHKKDLGGNPANTLLTDKPLIINIVLWVLSVALILYR